MTQANRALIAAQTKRDSKRGHYVLALVLTCGSLTVAAATEHNDWRYSVSLRFPYLRA